MRRRLTPRPRFDRQLLTASFARILVLALLGFMVEYVLRPVIPLVILDRGGGAILVGLIAAVYALPPILLRPLIGRLADTWHPARVLRLGTLLASVSPVGLMFPGTALMAAVRLSQGTAWALWNVSTRTLMARESPPDRRGAASGYFLAMPAVAILLAPGLGVALYLATGLIGPVVVAALLGIAAFVLTIRLPPSQAQVEPDGVTSMRTSSWIVETSAMPAMLMTAAFMAADTLFTVFPPVYLAIVGGPVETLAIYYPAYGLVMAAGHFSIGRVSDLLGRGRATRIGCLLGAVGLGIAMVSSDIVLFAAGGAAYAIGASFVAPALSALSIDRAPAHRLGSAMATYSIGYQLAIGGSALLWGPLITIGGFKAAFGAAIALVFATLAASYRYGDAPR